MLPITNERCVVYKSENQKKTGWGENILSVTKSDKNAMYIAFN